MKTLEQLLAEWEEGAITPEGLDELKQLLAQPEARKELVSEWLFYEAVYGTLRAIPAPVKPVLKVAPKQKAKSAHPRLIRQPAPRRRFLPWLVWHEYRVPLGWALGICLVLSIAWLAFQGIYLRFPAARLAQLTREVTILRKGKTLPAQPGQLVYPRDTVKVAPGSRAVLEWLNEPTELELNANALLEVRNPLFGKSLMLKVGSLKALVAPQPRWRPLTIKTPHVQATVVGTRFSMEVTTASVRLDVLQGAVSLLKTQPKSAGEKQPVLVRSGEFVLTDPETALKPQPLRGFAIREISELPAGNQPLSGTPGNLVFFEQLTNLISGGHIPGLAVAPDKSYAERIRCYLFPPVTGTYTFWLSSAGKGEVWLSTSAQPADKRRILTKEAARSGGKGATSTFTWQIAPATPGQTPTVLPGTGKPVTGARMMLAEKSLPVKLVAGQPYYLEINQPFTTNEYQVVWWTKPGQPAGTSGEVLGGSLLTPFTQGSRWAANPNP